MMPHPGRRLARVHETPAIQEHIVESPMIAMDHDTLLLAGELVALFALGALGLWRLHRNKHLTDDAASDAPAYDMRRDGQREIPIL
jgi:hypothetical protein